MSRGSPVIFNILTVLVLIGACGVGVCFALIAFNPTTVPGDLQEVALPTVLPTPLPTATSLIDTFPTPITPTARATALAQVPSESPTQDDATSTEGPSPTPSKSATVTQTGTVTQTATQTLTQTLVPTSTQAGPTASPTRTESPFAFTIQPGSPTYQPNYANTAGCNWMGVAGQAFDLSGNEIVGLIVRVQFEDGTIDSTTGSNKSYGPGGYEIYLNDHPVATGDAYTIRLLNSSGSQLSGAYNFVTFADCERNLIIVNFTQNH